MRLKFIIVVMPSRCCSHWRLFCSSASLSDISVVVRLFQWDVEPWLERHHCGGWRAQGGSRFSAVLRAYRALLWAGVWEKAPFLRSMWRCSLTKPKNFWFSGCCSLVSLQREGMGCECCWQIFLGSAFFATRRVLSAYFVEVFCVALPLKPWILFLWFPLEYCKICIWHWALMFTLVWANMTLLKNM